MGIDNINLLGTMRHYSGFPSHIAMLYCLHVIRVKFYRIEKQS